MSMLQYKSPICPVYRVVNLIYKKLKTIQNIYIGQKQSVVEGYVSYSGLFTFLVGWYTSAVSLPPGDVILVKLAWPLNDVIFEDIRNN
jgi:hypothetical protein